MMLVGFYLHILPTSALSISVGQTYTCSLGSVSNLKEAVWTTSDYKCLNFVGTVSKYSTEVTVEALAKPSYSTPVTIHCQYYYYDLDPTTGRYTYLKSDYKDFQFFIGDGGDEQGNDISVTEITLNAYSIKMNVQDTRQLTANILPDNATNRHVSWKSNNTTVATVTNYGLVTAMSIGSATITCKSNDGSGTYAKCKVEVTGEANNCVVMKMINGERIEYLLDLSPVITQVDGSTIRITTDSIQMDIQIEKIAEIYLSHTTNDIYSLKTDDEIISSRDGLIEFYGFGKLENVMIFTINGQKIMEQKTDSSGQLSISLQGLPKGIYVIKTKNQSVKIIKK